MFDVAIIGCGPVGALAANLLGKSGLKVLVLEKEINPFPLPRAVHLDHEMMRLFQSAGVINDVLNDMRDTQGHLHIGADYGVMRYMGTVGKPRPYGWSNDYFFYQPELENHLRQALKQYPNVELRLGSEFDSLIQTDSSVMLNIKTSSGVTSEKTRWVIACDGASSKVRKSLTIKLEDLQFEEPWLVVDAEVDGDVQFPKFTGVPEEADLQQLSVMLCDPKRPTTIVPGRGNHRRWEMMLLPGENDQSMMQPDKVLELVGPYLNGVPHKIIRAATYRFHGLIAEQWRLGQVFLAGDAAHQTPPFFGQGMCHGLRDVANLAWKMSAIKQGLSDEALLDTYQIERDPRVRSVISSAVDAGKYICILDPQKATERDATVRRKVAQNELPNTAAELIPAIQSGVIATETTKAGVRFIQPHINGHLMDNQIEADWKLFVTGEKLAQAAKTFIDKDMSDYDMSVTDVTTLEDGGSILSWLKEAEADSVLVRPDFYVYGTALNDVSGLLTSLLGHMQMNVNLEKSA